MKIVRVKEMKPMGLLVKAEKVSDKHLIYVIQDENNEDVFRSMPMVSSANLSCFLGVCHAISILEDFEYEPYIHTNNMTALHWVKNKNVNTVIEDKEMVEYIEDSITYLNETDMDYECFHYSWKKP